LYTREFKFDYPMARNSRTLREVLQQQSLAVRAAVEEEVRGVLDTHADESAYISSVVNRFSVKIPQFDFNPEHIKKAEEYEQMPSPHQGILPNQTVRVWVVNFGIPYVGDIDSLRYIPPAGSDMSFPQFTYDRECIWFRAWTPDSLDRDVQKIKAEKEKAIAFLQKRLADVAPELEAFNQQLPTAVQTLFENLKQKYQKDKDILAQL
jgi:hypothetical protein